MRKVTSLQKLCVISSPLLPIKNKNPHAAVLAIWAVYYVPLILAHLKASIAEVTLIFVMKVPKVVQKNSLVPMRKIMDEHGWHFKHFVNYYRK